MNIRILLTGGTFDKKYNELTATLDFSKSHIATMLEVARNTVDTEVEQLFLKDSLDVTDADRNLVVESCKSVLEDKVIITHGTDTMVETALKISEVQLTEKTIVLTGSLVPYSLGVSSDAMFNLGTAIAFVQTLKPGVYVVMNGRCFDARKVQKNKTTGKFVETR